MVAEDVGKKIHSTVEIMDFATNLNDKTVTDYISTGSKSKKLSVKLKRSIHSQPKIPELVLIASASEHLNALTEKLNAILNKFRT